MCNVHSWYGVDLVCGWCDSANTWFLCTSAYIVSAHRQSRKRCCLTWNHVGLLNMQSSMLVRPLKTGRHRNAYRNSINYEVYTFWKENIFFVFWTVCENCSCKTYWIRIPKIGICDHIAVSSEKRILNSEAKSKVHDWGIKSTLA
jgi:hypothetical protein